MWRTAKSSTGFAAEQFSLSVGNRSSNPAWVIAAAAGAALAVPLLIVASLATYLIVVAAVFGLPIVFLVGFATTRIGRLFAERAEVPSEVAITSTDSAIADREPLLATVRAIADPATHAMLTIVGATGACPRGLHVGQVLAIDKGRASAPLCFPAIVAVRQGLERLQTYPALSETEVSCDCPIPGRAIRFCIERGDGVQRALPVAA